MRHSERTYRVVFVTKYQMHHHKPDWEGKHNFGRNWMHSMEFKSKRNAERFFGIIKFIAKTGIIGSAFIFERLHSDTVSFKEV